MAPKGVAKVSHASVRQLETTPVTKVSHTHSDTPEISQKALKRSPLDENHSSSKKPKVEKVIEKVIDNPEATPGLAEEAKGEGVKSAQLAAGVDSPDSAKSDSAEGAISAEGVNSPERLRRSLVDTRQGEKKSSFMIATQNWLEDSDGSNGEQVGLGPHTPPH